MASAAPPLVVQPSTPRGTPGVARALAAVVVLALMALLAGCGSGGESGSTATEDTAPGIRVTAARLPAPASTDVAAAYFRVTNLSDVADVLESARTDAGGTAQVHAEVVKNGVESMRPLGPVAIGGHQSLVLQPAHLHLMIFGLTRPLRVGDAVTVTLHFHRAGDVVVRVPVVSASSAFDSTGGMTGMTGMST